MPRSSLDTLLTWSDIDYMDGAKVFTLGKSFPLSEMRDLVKDLHANNQHYIVMVDPGNNLKAGLQQELTGN